MKISARTRYGTRLMLALALAYEKGPLFLRNIAEQEEISEKYLSQIIIPLKAKGLVISFRGASGGYSLSRPPTQIAIKEIVEVLEGGLHLLECIPNPKACRRLSICVTHKLWSELGENITNTLSSVTLQDLVEKYSAKNGQNSLIYNI